MAAAAGPSSSAKRARRASRGGPVARPGPPPRLTRAQVKLPPLDHVLVEYDGYTGADGEQTHIMAYNFEGLRVFLENWATDQLPPRLTPLNSAVIYLARQRHAPGGAFPDGQYDAELHAPMFYLKHGDVHGRLIWTLQSWSSSRYFYGPSLTAVQPGTYGPGSAAGEFQSAAAVNPTPETYMIEMPVEVNEVMRWVRVLAFSVDQTVRAEAEQRQAIAAEAHDALVSDLYGEVAGFLGYGGVPRHKRISSSRHRKT